MQSDISLPTLLPAVAILAANAVFVVLESALVAVRDRDPRGNPTARHRFHFDDLCLLVRLGRSLSTLSLGVLLIPLLLEIRPGTELTGSGAVAVAILVAAMLHAVLGVGVPRVVGRRHSDGLAEALSSRPVRVLCFVLRPITWPLGRVVRGAAHLSGLADRVDWSPTHSTDDIQRIVARGHAQGVVEEEERQMIDGVFEFSRTVAREVMTPRIDIVAVSVDVTLPELTAIVVREGYSRIPVYEGSIDTVVGVLLVKDLLPLLVEPSTRPARFELRRIIREPYFVPDGAPVDGILGEFRRKSVHLAIVLDEFGGTYGLVTTEDLLEEIVGEIHDEYDVAEPDFAETEDGDVLIDGGAAVSDVNERFGLGLSEDDFDTIGGFIFGTLGRVPAPGDEVAGLGPEGALALEVEEVEERRIVRIRLRRAAVPSPSAGA